MRKPKVGDKLYLVRDTLINNSPKVGYDCKVVKVGRKFFTVQKCDSSIQNKFYIKDWRLKSQYTSYLWLYESKEVYEEGLNRIKYFEIIKNHFKWGLEKEFTTEQLKKVAALLNIDLEESEK